MLFSLCHCIAIKGARSTASFFAISAVVSFLMEETGVRTGLVYGRYHYSEMLGPKLGHLPILIPLVWFVMIYPSWVVARGVLGAIDTCRLPGIAALAAVAALVMTAWDLVMDPGMAAAGNWVWERGGAYFGVPRWNYAGWLLMTFLVYLAAGWLGLTRAGLRGTPRGFAALPVAVYALFALRYIVASRIPALGVIALLAMGTPGW